MRPRLCCGSSVLVVALEHQPVAGFDIGCGPGGEFDDQISASTGEATPRSQPLDATDDAVDGPDGVDGEKTNSMWRSRTFAESNRKTSA